MSKAPDDERGATDDVTDDIDHEDARSMTSLMLRVAIALAEPSLAMRFS